MEYTEKRKRKRDDHYSVWASVGVAAAFMWRNLVVKPTRFMLGALWLLTLWTARAAWRTTVWTVHQTWALTKWTALAPFRAVRGLYNTFVRGIPEPDDPFQAIRWRIKRRFRRRQRFLTHLFAFLGVNFIAVADALMNSFKYQAYTGRSLMGYGVIMTFWLVLIVFHFMRMRLADAEDHAMQSALERQTPYLVEDDYARYARLTASDDERIETDMPHLKRKRS